MDTVSSVLLVGASGRVGRMLVHHWPNVAAQPLLATARNPIGLGLSPMVHLVIWSPLDGPWGLMDHLMTAGQTPTALVMMAGVTPRAGRDPAELAMNSRLADACLEAAHAAGIGRVLLASSSAVYGVDSVGMAFSEAASIRSVSPYGLAKLAMEAVADPWRDRGVEVCALRIGNVAGADALLGQVTQGGVVVPLRIDSFADGLGPMRSYVGPASLARMISALALRAGNLPTALNVAAPDPVRMSALAEAAGLPYVRVAAPDGAVQTITLDCSLLGSLVSVIPADSDPLEMVRQWQATRS